jgi:hypothetical protein
MEVLIVYNIRGGHTNKAQRRWDIVITALPPRSRGFRPIQKIRAKNGELVGYSPHWSIYKMAGITAKNWTMFIPPATNRLIVLPLSPKLRMSNGP